MKEKKKCFLSESYLRTFLLFLAFLFFGEQAGLYNSPLNPLLGLISLIFFLMIFWRDKRSIQDHRRKIVLYLTTFLMLTLIMIAPLPAIRIGLTLVLTIYLNGLKVNTETKTGLIFWGYILCDSYVPHFFLLQKAVTDFCNILLNRLAAVPIQFSPYAYGFGFLTIVIGYSVLQLCRYIRKKEHAWKKGFLYFTPLFLYFLLQVAYFKISTLYLALPKPNGYGLDKFFHYYLSLFLPMNGQVVIFSLVMTGAFLTQHFLANGNSKNRHNQKKPILQSKIGRVIPVFLLTLMLIFFFWNMDIYQEPSAQKPCIYIYDTKMDFSTVPNDNVFGIHNGLFGMLADYLRDWGYHVEYSMDWKAANPHNHDILLIINPSGKMEPKEKSGILSFIKNGGRLLFLGDHTLMFGLDNDYFGMIKEAGIAFNFDTAIYFRKLWQKSLRSPIITWDQMVRRENFEANIVQGASLTLKYPASPVIIGRYGWSDLGNINNAPGYLGDRIYSTNEYTGDLVLAAERTYGRGKILVFGDTSFLQNSPVAASYPLIKIALAHLAPKNFILLRLFLPFLFLAPVLYLSLWGNTLKYQAHHWSLPLLLILFSVMLCLGYLLGSDTRFYDPASTSSRAKAGIDTTLYPGFFRDDWDQSNRGIGGLKNTLYRNNLLPYLLYGSAWQDLNTFNYLFIIAPNKIMNRRQADAILKYIQKGGNLICASGFEHKKEMQELLHVLGLDIKNIPLSTLTGTDTDRGIRFISAWALQTRKVSNLKHTVLCTAWNKYPVIIQVEAGKGKAVFISDSHFFENRNLEEGYSIYAFNQDFFRKVLVRP